LVLKHIFMPGVSRLLDYLGYVSGKKVV